MGCRVTVLTRCFGVNSFAASLIVTVFGALVLQAAADVVELKTGERIKGALE